MKSSCIFLVLVGCFWIVQGLDSFPPTNNGHPVSNETAEVVPSTKPSLKAIEELAKRTENRLKDSFKDGVRTVLSSILSRDKSPTLSPNCIKAFMKLMSDLKKTRVWALKMLDASSKLPAGILEGTLADYGSFDECLDISVPLRNGSEDFSGRYCAIEAGLRLPPLPKNYSLSNQPRAKPFDTLATQILLSSNSLHYLNSRLGICVPSSCSREDMTKIFASVVNATVVSFNIQKCYVKEAVRFQPVHIGVLCVLAVLVILALSGTILENLRKGKDSLDSVGLWRLVSCFSLMSNSRRLTATSKSNGELKALHGIRALSMAWVILGHTYIWTKYNRGGRSSNIQAWFNDFAFEAVLNGWLAVEMFFFLSGALTCYTALQVMEKAKGRLNIPMFIIHRYLRLTPPLLMTMGVVFFLPLISSGPFWHEHVDPELEACRNNWWLNFLYISNWMPMTKVCIHTMWYLAADFQMYVLSPIVLLLLYRCAMFGMTAMVLLAAGCNILVGVLTHIYELTPAVIVSPGNTQLISDEVDLIHMRTYTHVGSYCVGMATGYIMLKNKSNLQLNKWQNILGWSASIFLSVSSIYGVHQWNTGHYHAPFLTPFYAAMHRTTFTLGVAWVATACVTGNAGPVNWILSHDAWVPFSKLTYAVYLMHGPVLWTRFGSIRERFYLSHYNMIYEFAGNVAVVVTVSLPLYLLVEAPVNNLEHMFFSKTQSKKREMEEKHSTCADMSSYPTSHSDSTFSTKKLSSAKITPSGEYQSGFLTHGTVVLTSVKSSTLGEHQNEFFPPNIETSPSVQDQRSVAQRGIVSRNATESEIRK